MASNPAEIMAAGQALVPNYADQELRRQMGQLQLQGATLQNQAQAAALADHKRAIDRQAAFATDFTGYLAHPTTTGLISLFGSHPEFHDQIKEAHSALDEDEQRVNTTQLGSVAALAAKGDFTGAAGVMQRRIAADRAAGHDTSDDQAILDHLNDPDPAKQKAALALTTIALAGAVGPEKAASFLKANGLSSEPFTLSQGEVRYGADGQPIASVAPKPDYLIIPEGGKAVPVGPGAPQGTIQGNPSAPTGGGGPVSGGVAGVRRVQGWTPRASNGGDNSDHVVDSKIATISAAIGADPDAPLTPAQLPQLASAIARTEGGPGTLAARNNNPTNIKDGKFARSQPGYVGPGAGGYAKFATPEAGLGAAQALLGTYFGRGQRSIRDIIEGRPVGGAATASAPAAGGARPGDPPGTIYGNAKPGYTLLTPAQAQARGLNPAKTWQAGPDGQTTAIGDAATTAAPGDPNLTGEAYLSSLKNPALATRIRGIASGMLPYPPQGRTTNQTLLNALSQFEPTLDANAYNQRKAAVQAFTGNGKAAQTIGSANRAAAHLGDLLDASAHLSGPDLKWGPLSSLVASGMQGFERAAAVKYDQAATFLADEAEKIARNSPGTAHGIEMTLKNLSRANSRETRDAAAKELASLIHGAVEPLQSQYESAFQGAAVRPKIPWISPTAMAIYRHAGVDFSDVTVGGGGSSAPAAGGGAHSSLPAGAHPVLKADGTPATSGGKPVYEWTGRDGKPHRAVPQ